MHAGCMFGSAIHCKTASDPAKKQRKTQRKRWAERCSTRTRKSNMRISVLPALLAAPVRRALATRLGKPKAHRRALWTINPTTNLACFSRIGTSN